MNGKLHQEKSLALRRVRRFLRKGPEYVKIYIRPLSTQKMKDYLLKLKGRMGITWMDLIVSGAKYVLEEERKVADAVMLNSYVMGFQTKRFRVAHRRRKSTNYKEMYIFHISKSNQGKYNLWFKWDLEGEIQIIRIAKSYVHHKVRDQFCVDIDELIPD